MADQEQPSVMKALTICQPYAELIARGEKRVENRTWPTSYRGQLAIHAGKSKAWLDDEYTERCEPLVFGAVVAIADLVDCVHIDRASDELLGHEHTNGPWCWVLANVRRIEPVPYRGALGLWECRL